MSSPLRRRHSLYDGEMGFLLEIYSGATPGVEVLHNATTILGTDNEPQPDLGLRILPECGGDSQETDDDYVLGPLELLVEIAASSRAIDFGTSSTTNTVMLNCEYIVVSVEEPELHWFDFRSGDPIASRREGSVLQIACLCRAMDSGRSAASTQSANRRLDSSARVSEPPARGICETAPGAAPVIFLPCMIVSEVFVPSVPFPNDESYRTPTAYHF